MARIPGRLGRAYISTDGECTWVAIGCLTDIDFNGSQEQLEATCKDDGQFKSFIPGRKEATLDFTARWDEEDAGQELMDAAFFSATRVAIRFRMQERTGAKEYIAKGLITDYSMSSPNDDIAELSGTIQLSGDFSSSAQA